MEDSPKPSQDAARPSNRNPVSRSFLLLTLGLVAGLWGGVTLQNETVAGCSSPQQAPNFGLIDAAWKQIDRHYVDRSALVGSNLTYGAISGLVDALGDTAHSAFLTPAMVQRLNQTRKGQFQGIGAEIRMKDGHVVVVAPLDGSPAQRAGLRPGDIIVKVNGRGISDLPLDQVVARISGPAGTRVNLTFLEPHSGQTHEVSLERASIKLHTVTWIQLPGTEVAHLRIAAFEAHTAHDLQTALVEIKKAKLRGVILDLRNNPGGLLDEAVDSASEFLHRGNVLLAKDAQGHIQAVPIKPGAVATNEPMVALINNGTASGAEILAGALRDAHRATLVGTTTFGTGTVLEEFSLPGGSAVLLAVKEWLTPDGHSFWHKGIAPAVTVSLPAGTEILRPGSERDMTAAQLKASGDDQLLRALKVLTGITNPATNSALSVRMIHGSGGSLLSPAHSG